MKFPLVYTQFQTKKCQIISPMDGVLKRGANVSIRCYIPDALDATVIVDSQPTDNTGFSNSILEKNIRVGSEEVMICGKFHKKSDYSGLVSYIVK